MDNLTYEELVAIRNALDQLILDGFAIDDSDPIVTAFRKIEDLLDSY